MRCFLLYIFISISHFCVAEKIQTIGGFQEVNLDNLSKESLFLFDIDEVLLTPADILLRPAGKTFSGWCKIQPEKFDHYLSIMLAGTNYILVDKKGPDMIARLSKKGVSVMGFTSCRTGPFGVIQSMEKWRSDQLHAVGIDFRPFFSEEYVFAELVDAKSNPPLFKNGILFCGDFYSSKRSTKGELLGIFLDRMNWRPEQIVFIDDEKKNLEAVSLELDKRGIPFQGYLLEKPSTPLDEKIAQLQIQTIVEKKKWISDREAKIIIQNP